MKLRNLNLIAFGPFSDCCIDLSQGEQALQMIYGPNEAGKSSSLLAITYLLYGFPKQTPVDFIHPYKNLRVGGKLFHSDGRELEFVRRKALQKSLRCAADVEPLDDDALLAFLGDVDQSLFTTMFGINHECLRRAGRDISQGRGRIGEMLFAAGAGLVDLQQVQQELNNRSEQLLKNTGRSGSIHVAIQDYLQKRKRVDEALISVEAWNQVEEELQASRQLKIELDQRLAQAQRELQKLQRIKSAIPIIDRWKIRRQNLGELSHVPKLPEDFAQSTQQLSMDLRTSETRLQTVEAELANLDQQLKTLSVPDELLQASDKIEALRDRVGAIRNALMDRAGVEAKRDSFERETKHILRELGRPTDVTLVEQMRLPRDKVVKIQGLGNRLERLQERRLIARKQCEKLHSEIEGTEARLKTKSDPADLSGMRATLQSVQQHGDLEAELATLNSELLRLQSQLTHASRQLPLFVGEASELVSRAVPSEATVDRYQREIAAADQQLQSLQRQLKEESEAVEKLQSRLAELEAVGNIPTVTELSSRRLIRDHGWQLVLNQWQNKSTHSQTVAEFISRFPIASDLAGAFQQSLRETDELADALRHDADRVATKAKLELDQAQVESRLERWRTELQRAQEKREALEQEWCQLWQAWGFRPLSPSEMHDWLRRQAAIVLLVQQLKEAELRQQSLQQKIAHLREPVLRALAVPPSNATYADRSLKELLQVLQDKVDQEQQSASQRGQWTEQLLQDRAELSSCQTERSQIDEEVAEIQAQWTAEMQHLGLESSALPAQANSRLASLQNLFETYKEAERFRSRLNHIDQDAAQFTSEVSELIQWLAPELSAEGFEVPFQQLMAKLERARLAANQRSDLRRREKSLVAQKAQLQAQVERTQALLDEMVRQAQVAGRHLLLQAAEQSRQRQSLEKELRDLQDAIVEHCAGVSLADFIKEVEIATQAEQTIDSQIATWERVHHEVGEARDTVLKRIERVRIEEEKFDGSSLAIERQSECESIATELETEVQTLAVLRVATTVLNAAIERHRQKNQGPILGRASEIFAQITAGRFVGLQAEYNEKGEPILAGIRQTENSQSTAKIADAERVTVEGMSDGTCDQLYLALRVASLESWLKHHEPIPFIVDDILMNFDDARAVATLKILAELAQRTQVIFFTHHQHLLQLARQHLSAEQLHVTSIAAPSSTEARKP